jgi:hypothetical protein
MRTNRNKPVEARYFYSAVDDALAVALDIDDASRVLFRSRIKHFLRLGIAGARPGKGSALEYSFAQVAKLALVLLLADVGLTPTACVELIKKRWETDLHRRVQQALGPDTRDEELPFFLTLRLQAMRGPWAKRAAIAEIGAFRTGPLPPPSDEQREAAKALMTPEEYAEWLALRLGPPQQFTGIMRDDLPRMGNVCILSLSHVMHRLKDHLDRNGAKS